MGMAAHLEDKGVLVLDMAGLAQKGGAVMSHVRIAADPTRLHAARVPAHQADLVLGCDLMVGAAKDALMTMDAHRTHAVMNTVVVPTGSFTQDPDWEVSAPEMLARVAAVATRIEAIDASAIATALMGDAVATNVFLLGFALQKGWVPLQEASLRKAIELNGAAVPMNLAAFAWGRQAALDLGAVRAAAGLDAGGVGGDRIGQGGTVVVQMPARTATLAHLLADRVLRLTAYQNRAHAERYAAFVRDIAAQEHGRTGTDRVAREVAVSLDKLMAYKDEYEVARLYAESGFFDSVEKRFEGDFKLRFHLAPPLLARRDNNGHLIKQSFGPWIATAFKWLAKARSLRGTALDVFGYMAERRGERAAIGEFETLMREVVGKVDAQKLHVAVELARLPQSARGFGHVKARNEGLAQVKRVELLERLHAAPEPVGAAQVAA